VDEPPLAVVGRALADGTMVGFSEDIVIDLSGWVNVRRYRYIGRWIESITSVLAVGGIRSWSIGKMEIHSRAESKLEIRTGPGQARRRWARGDP